MAHRLILRRDQDPMTRPVRPTSPADQAWADLAAQLTPAAALARIDAVIARAATVLLIAATILTC
jgi:hypothetical protein